MSIAIYFGDSAGFTVDVYDEVVKRLEEAGAGSPPGREYHVAMANDGLSNVFDIWDSMESFEAFGQTLVPIMEELGVAPAEPMVVPIHNVIDG